MGTVNMMGKCVLSAVGPPLSGPGLQVGPADHFLLYLHEQVARDDRLVAVFHVVLWDDTLVRHALLCQEVGRYCFLEQGITDVLLIHQNLTQRAGKPEVAACRCFDDSDETRYRYYVVAALLDTSGNLVYVNTNRLESIGLHPGSTATFSLYIDSDNINYLEANGIQVSSVDAIVYYREE
jgi:hypothetical protein